MIARETNSEETPRPSFAGFGSVSVEDIQPGQSLAGARLAGLDLSGRDLSGCDLSGADLNRADLSGARLIGADLSHATLYQANIEGAQLLNCQLIGADLNEVRGSEAVFGNSNLSDAVLFNADLEGASFTHSIARSVDFRATKLNGARMRDADLAGSDFSKAEMTGADLTNALVHSAAFRDTDLQSSHLRNMAGYESADWIGVDLHDADFAGAYLARRMILDQNYLHEFRSRSRLNAFLYQVWWLTSDCGRSFARWAMWTAIVALTFAGLYTTVAVDYGDYQTTISPLYFSVVTLTTLGYGDAVPASLPAQMMALAEVILGYVMLGGLLSIFATKMGRRAE